MELYLKKRRDGKLLHDPLAMCVAIDRHAGPLYSRPDPICRLSHVRAYREKGEWGSDPFSLDPNAWITTSVDRDRFFSVLMEC